VRGIGAEYHTFGVNPTFSHDRFHEAHDLIVRAWTEPGPFPFHGHHYTSRTSTSGRGPTRSRIRRSGSRRRGARRRSTGRRIRSALHLLADLQPVKVVQRYLKRTATPAPARLRGQGQPARLAVPVYVGDTDASARAEAKQHFEAFRNVFVKMPLEMLLRRATPRASR